jgi:anti-sigma B factor antagonist
MSVSIARPSLLTVGTRRTDGNVWLTLTGDLDAATNHLVRNAVVQACDRQPIQKLLVDLDALKFLDSTGISTLVWARDTALANGIAFVVVNCHGMPRRALEVTGLYSVLVRETACGQID